MKSESKNAWKQRDFFSLTHPNIQKPQKRQNEAKTQESILLETQKLKVIFFKDTL
jgi:hypothetical protein